MQDVQLRDFLNFSFLSALTLSPDGKNAGFVVSRCDEARDGYQCDFWRLDLTTGKTHQVSRSGNVRSFLWLDDDTVLLKGERSSSLLSPSTSFLKLKLDGGEALPAFTVPLFVEEIKRVDDRRFVLLARTTLYPAEDLPEGGADWTVLNELPFAENGAGYVSGIRHRLYLFDSVTGALTPLTGETFQVRNGFAVRRDGGMIAYMGMDIDYMEVQKLGIFVYEVATGETRQLLPLDRYKLRHIDFLGDKVLFTGADGSRYIWSQNAWFYTLDAVTGEEQVLCSPFQMPVNNSINSDCRYGGGRMLQVVDGGVYHVLTQDGSAHLARIRDGQEQIVSRETGSIDAIDVRGGTAYLIATRHMGLQEIYALDLVTGKETCLTAFNRPYVETHAIQKPEDCDFVNAHGDTVQGWVIHPAHEQPGQSYPGILVIHGGPKTAYGPSYVHEMQVWAARGYYVFFCNPTGSDGKGDEFGFLMTRYGTVDYDYLMAFTDVVLERYPQLDAKRLGVTGGSYGGYMTNWIIGHTDRFACAASQRSISNWITDEGASDWSYMYSPCRFGGVSARIKPADGWSSSPLKYVGNAVTPTLFLHSDEDFRCPLGEALQMYTQLIHQGVESRVCLFKGENHELSRSGKPWNRVKRLEEIDAWMDAHLKA